MIDRTEKLDKPVSADTLETAIREAAKEEELEIDGQKMPEKNGCTQTNFYLKKRFRPTIEVKTYDRGNPLGFYCVHADNFFGFSPKNTVEKYISKVHNYLEKPSKI